MRRSPTNWEVVFALTALQFCVLTQSASAQNAPVTIQTEIVSNSGAAKKVDLANTVVWLTPVNPQAAALQERSAQPQLVQHNRAFEPHVLVVQVGSLVQFPNKDHFLHNVFSLFDGKRFDLGFYEAGSSKTVKFDRAGISFLFCNIHPEMTAAVVSVPTPYFGISDSAGRVTIASVPDGNYVLHVWSERSLPEQLKQMEKTIVLSPSQRTLPVIRVVENPNFSLAHKNKYGQDYVPPSGGTYDHP
jgi:plastocyanin